MLDATKAVKIHSGKLSVWTKLGFGICDLGGNLFFTLMGFYLLYFMTDIVGLAAGLAGTALMVGKIWDAVTDPTIGYLSDRPITTPISRQPETTSSVMPTSGRTRPAPTSVPTTALLMRKAFSTVRSL